MNKVVTVGNKKIRILSTSNNEYYAHLYINNKLVYTKEIRKDNLTSSGINNIIDELKNYQHAG